MAFQEFYCTHQSNGNFNGGSGTGAPTVQYDNGTWVSATRVFTPASGDPIANGVVVGDWCHVYVTASPAATFYARCTARTTTTITLSATASFGTPPADGTSTRTLICGGAWHGPIGATSFPFGTITAAAVDASGNMPRVNFKNDATFAITAGITHSLDGPIIFEGYTTTPGDDGRAAFNCATVGASIVILTLSGRLVGLRSLVFSNTGANATASSGLVVSGISCGVARCVAHTVRANGFSIQGSGSTIEECEAYNCNLANTAGFGGIEMRINTSLALRCISHHNTGSNACGFLTGSVASQGGNFQNCIAHANGSHGFFSRDRNGARYYGCDAYDNGGDGLRITETTTGGIEFIENCNFVKNDGYGIQRTDALSMPIVKNCGFGTGTMANTLGHMAGFGIVDGTVVYPADVTPWANPDDGDFSIVLDEAIGTGRGAFLQTQSGYGDPNPTIAYPDIGAGQSEDTGGGGGGGLLKVGAMTGGMHRT